MNKLRSVLVCGLALSLMLALIVAAAPGARASYGKGAQWQVGFSGNFDAPTSPTGGFWGWCAFGGSSGSSAPGTVGTAADCEFNNYFRSSVGLPNSPFVVSFDVTSWAIGTGSAFLPPGVPGFFFTNGTATLTGPGPTVAGLPTHVPIPLSFPCANITKLSSPPPTDLSSLAGSPCDTGIPAMPGHFAFVLPGVNIQIQVTKIGS